MGSRPLAPEAAAKELVSPGFEARCFGAAGLGCSIVFEVTPQLFETVRSSHASCDGDHRTFSLRRLTSTHSRQRLASIPLFLRGLRCRAHALSVFFWE